MEIYTKNVQDGSENRLVRKSAITRIILGTITCTGCSVLYALAHAKYRNLDFQFVKNWLKGSLVFSSSFYTLNEGLLAVTKYYGVYTNFWINYSVVCYFLSKVHYRYLIRNHMMKWYMAIKYSHKCFLYFLVANLFIELIVYLFREIQLYDGEDIFDIVKNKYMDENGNPNFDMTYDEIEKVFRAPWYLLNSADKVRVMRKHMRENPNHSHIKTIDLYELYKNKMT